jgi:DNA-binding transcriptional ArsR family regulator
MTTATPRVRDFTTSGRRLHVEVVSGDAFEALLTLYALVGAGGDELDFQVEESLLGEVQRRAPNDLLSELRERGDWSVWVAAIGTAYAMGPPHTMERLLDHLAGMDPVQVRRDMLEVGAYHVTDPISADEVEAWARGPVDSGEPPEALSEKCPGLVELLRLRPEESLKALVGMLHRFWMEAAPVSPSVAASIDRDADHKRVIARRMDPERLVEEATNGVTAAVRAGLDGVVLVPSVIIRPWVLITERGPKQIFCYPVAEENMGGDPDSPPPWLVQFYKALGDERRLAILRRLAEGPAALTDLAEHLDLAKSTVHHHMRQLRTAGLVRVTVGDDKEFSLRSGSVPEATRLLEGFLGINARADDGERGTETGS